MYLKREAEQIVAPLLAGDKVTIILGARQVGKTTLVRHVLAGHSPLILNFDVDVDKTRFKAASTLSPEEGIRSLGNPPVLVIDEAQRLPDTSRIIKGWHDAGLPSICWIRRRRVSPVATESSYSHRCSSRRRSETKRGCRMTPPTTIFARTSGRS